MSTTLTEVAANADFTTGITVPQGGVDSFATAATIIKDNSLQELADRSQWLKDWQPDELILNVPLLPTQNDNSRFALALRNTSIVYYSQVDVTTAGNLGFTLPPLPMGRKIKKVVALWRNAVAAGLPGTMPIVALYKTVYTTTATNSTVGSQVDTAAVLADYQAFHEIVLTLNETIAADGQYAISFTGETTAAGGQLGSLRVYVEHA